MGRQIDELTGPLAIAARGIRDSVIRAQLVEILNIINARQSGRTKLPSLCKAALTDRDAWRLCRS